MYSEYQAEKTKERVVFWLMVLIQSSTSTVVATTIFIATIVIFLTVTISAFAQWKSMNESLNYFGILANQTTQNMTQSSTQTDEPVQQDDNQTNEASKVNAIDSGSNSTEVPKNIRKNLIEVAKKLDEAISNKLQLLAK